METQESQTNPVSYKNQLPNSSGILAMGIISLVSLCCCIPSGNSRLNPRYCCIGTWE